MVEYDNEKSTKSKEPRMTTKFNFYMKTELMDKIDQRRGDVPRAAFIRRLIYNVLGADQ